MVDRHDQTLMDKSMRSVFVGNIPYEATEEKLKDIFCEVGPVLSLKLVFDRESGKPKGYGFCEYKDQETALSAMRNLNGYEFGGRALRVDNACTEKSRMEMAALLQGPQVENPYGDECDPADAPDLIAKAVTGLQPDQMYELMRQAKACVQNDPEEARNMLLENPQLTYALLQSAVVMRIVDAHTALSFLHARHTMPPVLSEDPMSVLPGHEPIRAPFVPDGHGGPMQGSAFHDSDERHLLNDRAPHAMDMDLRMMDPFMGGHRGPEMIQGNIPESSFVPIDIRPQRQVDPRLLKDPRLEASSSAAVGLGSMGNKPIPPAASLDHPAAPDQGSKSKAGSNDASDQEKAALIMQVLQLSDEQIALLPQDQRASILVLKEQISRNAPK
ncbi:cleavage stimulation factor subunit 2 [Anopheles moucheti]|uniref:cleavage stimulation factor subunit 2 n=1 Tax=Anopheles moucheti TaxID=186751 RepID=UPI0022F078BD|nr:cleavage stimulation factor subunit 2 [Anopheles moucheti]